ncbi:probable LRR receptor-like serine/threonine-protein kinase At3g47570 [Ziziphus jujuba]|uniref:Probable LRR receptor-like serine/threonine-protein kinase At3g47570 n=1 Tax=Ziziphus jujuba TaxID=326968 RepID=A0ABM3IAY5_ZIZJJ|nr:probable LRR receptor-like serine/threonine-protein kinase At3g47570 [Ziziphus jujuba]
MLLNQKHILLFILFLLPSSNAFDCDEYTDCQTLLQFKKGIISDPFGHLQAWNTANPFCNWTGVTCHRYLQNRVIALELIDMHLQGTMSPFLSNLSLLTNLSLQSNRFHGEIPSSFGKLPELVYLNISSNNLRGEIPASLQGCQSLKSIDLVYNNLSGVIPEEIGWMKNLTLLALSENNLTGSIPSNLSNLTELTQLELAVNYFTGSIPPQLGALRKLEIFYLHMNFLTGPIPAALSNCTALREISLIENLLSGEIPLELGSKLQNLEKFYAWNNRLSGKIPVTLSNLSQLILLDLSVNNLEGDVPPELGMLKNLEKLYLHSNYLGNSSGNSSLSFLTALTNCSFLKKLHLGSCLFSGNLPASLGALSKDLFFFDLRNNLITGNIPESIGNLSNLVNLNLSYNFLAGPVPASLGRLGQLQRLSLYRNRISGPIPDEMGQMANLGLLDLGANLISGSIPPSLGNLSQLRYLYFSQNSLSGKFPIELTQCSLLMLLDLSYNNLNGPIPVVIDRLSKLALSLILSNNNFEGQIPETIGKLTSVQAIDFSKNKFSGAIPTPIGGCISLVYLNLSHNRLEGPIPRPLKLITHLEVLDLAHNQLNGTIPIWIGDEQVIKNLNLSYNRLSGEVPTTGTLTNYNRSSFLGNVGLCGGSAIMGFPPCEVQKQTHNIRKGVLYAVVAIGASCVLFLLAAVFVFCFFRKKDEKPDETMVTSVSGHGPRAYTQRELEIATVGFNEACLLGTGSFGSVYKADIDDGKTTIAVKVLRGDISQSYKLLKRECQILSGIKHRNLVGLLGSIWTSQFQALLLEFIPNGNLDQHLYPGGLEEEGCKLTLRERMSIAIDIANGLEYLQEGCPVQIVHCDLKPQNVLLDNDMVAHVADFGVGKLVSADKPKGYVSTTGFLRGSIGYIPPEYGQGIEVSAKGDIYSFGVMLLEMVTRKRPTSNMFTDGLDLRQWVRYALPDHILDVVDITLKQEANLGGQNDTVGSLHRLEQCCIQMLDLAMICTDDNPQNRPTASSVVQMLVNIWKKMGFKALSVCFFW